MPTTKSQPKNTQILDLNPFGNIQRFQVSRLGPFGTIYKIKANVNISWDLFSTIFQDLIEKNKDMINKLKAAIWNKNTEIQLQKVEFERCAELFPEFNAKWSDYFHSELVKLSKQVKIWKKEFMRGFFRLLVLICLATIMPCPAFPNKEASNNKMKGLGGLIKNLIKKVSADSIHARPSSLYVALEHFEKIGILKDHKLAKQGKARLSTTSLELIFQLMVHLNKILEFVRQSPILKEFKNINVNSEKRMVSEKLDHVLFKNVDVHYLWEKINSLDLNIKRLKDFIDSVANDDDDHDLSKDNLDPIVEQWKTNINRGFIDLFVLERIFSKTSYGMKIIKDAENSLKLKTG
ncbi:MAG: hypothetical protein ACTSWN_05545, partial [Promethearchaeota archaeon]